MRNLIHPAIIWDIERRREREREESRRLPLYLPEPPANWPGREPAKREVEYVIEM